ncbi:Glycosyl transferases group 1 [Falsiruegeria litorea R37]|uniref:Glycosyl transferases group 1 n=1 Tax=Falsiruegeria litorea R37 TaxID=1200284 RepID=A0A1Y5TX05_9RHOB|nr:glycosyltransferase [Falsiruegeria litorea]SLN74457.1 Glycosyl transferases group 1 [Falsiruegeria litorea R37]
MSKRPFVLISFESVDGYPPVQNQARLLAQAGHPVHLVTQPRDRTKRDVDFEAPGVTLHVLPWRSLPNGLRQARIMAGMMRLLWTARRQAARLGPPIEIAYNPLGVLISDLTLGRPQQRVAHFHETFMYLDELPERRLKRAIGGYSLVVVPDAGRVPHTMEALELTDPPLVIENYPYRAESLPDRGAPRDTFEVVYCGTFGHDQRIDLLIDSVPLWPEHARLVFIGNTNTRFGPGFVQKVKDMGLQDRITFTGWMATGAAETRLAQSDLAVALLDATSHQWRTALGASNKRYQYMKAGLPQIGDMNPGIPELLEGEGIGTCIRKDTPEALAELVAAYATDPERRLNEGAKAFALHQEQFNYGRVLQRLPKALGLS